MIYLLVSITAVLSVYVLSIYVLRRKVIAWKYKVFIYGTLTFIMLVSTFLTFNHYDKHWKKNNHPRSQTGMRTTE